jgi:undecaprenyl-diphosphatase
MTGPQLALDLALDRLATLDLHACRRLQHGSARWARQLLATVSRLGDGWLWLGVALLLLLADGAGALIAIGEMALAAALGLPLYKLLKRGTARPRPCAAAGSGLRALVPALDTHSFPSGHTLHAVAFTLVLLAHYPALAWALVPFTLLVALSRVVLGLHYPSDVLAGSVLGTVLGLLPRALG